MLLQLNGIGNQKISYKDHKDIKFDSLQTYVLLAKKAISKFANQIYNGLSSKMLKDEDAIASVANAIMMADWRWDENYQNEKGTKKTRYSYRNQCALWAIQTHVSKRSKKSKKYNNVYSLDYISESDDSLSAHNYTEDNRVLNPEQIAIKNEEKQSLQNLINAMLDSGCLTDRQRDYIKLYYFEDYTFDKIGKKYGITREAVRQGLNKALDIIRSNNV
jgi:RNA polymerase sigma factor (sigma-70 family)